MSKNTSTLKRAYCPKCKTDDETTPIFYTNPDADVCYCPNCMTKLNPKDAIDNYNYFISNKINKANRLLFRDTKFLEAYDSYGNILNIDATTYQARFGRILSLIYMSTLRKTNFYKASILLETEADQYFHKLKDQHAYAKFLSKVNYALDEYYKRFYKKLTVKDRFYSLNCVELYYLQLDEILKLKNFVYEEMEKIYAKAEDERTKLLMTEVKKSIKELKVRQDERIMTTDGNRYKFSKISRNHQVVIEKLEESVNPLTRYVHYKLDENEKKGKLLKEKVYPDNSHITSLVKGIFPIMIIALLGAVGLFISTFIFKNAPFKLWVYAAAAASLVIGLTTLVLYIVWKSQLAKRRHLID